MAAFESSRLHLQGLIASAGFASGDRIVVGCWKTGPLGAMNDVMWIRPDDSRVLIASGTVIDFVSAIYDFDDVLEADVFVEHDATHFKTLAGPVAVNLKTSRFAVPFPLGSHRPLWFTRFVESPIANLTMGLKTYGRTSGGLQEWYQAAAYRHVHSARASVDGIDCGQVQPIIEPLNVGFSNPPKQASIVSVRPTLHDTTGRLRNVLGSE